MTTAYIRQGAAAGRASRRRRASLVDDGVGAVLGVGLGVLSVLLLLLLLLLGHHLLLCEDLAGKQLGLAGPALLLVVRHLTVPGRVLAGVVESLRTVVRVAEVLLEVLRRLIVAVWSVVQLHLLTRPAGNRASWLQ